MDQIQLLPITEVSDSLAISPRETLEIAIKNRCTPYIAVPDGLTVYALNDLWIKRFNLSSQPMRAIDRLKISATRPIPKKETDFLLPNEESLRKLLIVPTVTQTLFKDGLEFCSIEGNFQHISLLRHQSKMEKEFSSHFWLKGLALFPRHIEQDSVWLTDTPPESARFSINSLFVAETDFERIRLAVDDNNSVRKLRPEPFMSEELQVLIETYNNRWMRLRPGDRKPTVGDIRRQLAEGYVINGRRQGIRTTALDASEKAIRPEWGQPNSEVTESNVKEGLHPHKLMCLIRAARNLWGGYDPESPDPDAVPHQSDVVAHLVELGVREHDAKILTPLLRPNGTPNARRRKGGQ